jgi:hypothetical protein
MREEYVGFVFNVCIRTRRFLAHSFLIAVIIFGVAHTTVASPAAPNPLASQPTDAHDAEATINLAKSTDKSTAMSDTAETLQALSTDDATADGAEDRSTTAEEQAPAPAAVADVPPPTSSLSSDGSQDGCATLTLEAPEDGTLIPPPTTSHPHPRHL